MRAWSPSFLSKKPESVNFVNRLDYRGSRGGVNPSPLRSRLESKRATREWPFKVTVPWYSGLLRPGHNLGKWRIDGQPDHCPQAEVN